MNKRLSLLALLGLGAVSCQSVEPTGTSVTLPAADQGPAVSTAQVAFRVGGLMKTKSGAT